MRYIKRNIARIIAYAIISFICAFFAQSCANAQSLSNNLRTINDTYFKYFENVANSLDYKNYIITSDYINNGSYNNYSIYYLCLTNDTLNNQDPLNISVSCEKLYTYYSYNNTYNYNIRNNENLVLNNNLYYSSSNKVNDTNIYLICLIIITSLIFCLIIFNRILRNRYGGLSYGKIS